MIEATPSPLPAAAAPSPIGRWWLDFLGAPRPDTPPPPQPAAADAPRRLVEGDVLGDWEVLRHLGSGGMGDVFEAYYRPGHQRYALKVLGHDHADDPMAIRRFELEYLALTKVRHEAIVAPFLAGCERGVRFYAMELLEGESLDRLYSRRLLSPLRAARIGLRAARALSALHERGIIHRDLKPGNIFVLAGDQVKLLDLGIAKLLPAFFVDVEMRPPPEKRPQTGPGVYMGTAGYMAPEVVLGARPAPAQDIFGLAVTIYRVITGRSPYSEILPPGPGDEPRPSASTGRPMPRALEDVLRRALSRDPALRQASMEAFRQQLELAVEEMEADEADEKQEDAASGGQAEVRDEERPPGSDAPTASAEAVAAKPAIMSAEPADPAPADPAPAVEAIESPPMRPPPPPASRWSWAAVAFPALIILGLLAAVIVGDLQGSMREQRAQSGTRTAVRLARAVDQAVDQAIFLRPPTLPATMDLSVAPQGGDAPVAVDAHDVDDREVSPPTTATREEEVETKTPTPRRRRQLGAAAFSRALRPHQRDLERCVRRLDAPALDAEVRVASDGFIESVHLRPAVSRIADDCLLSVLKGLRFPGADAPSTHTWPLRHP